MYGVVDRLICDDKSAKSDNQNEKKIIPKKEKRLYSIRSQVHLDLVGYLILNWINPLFGVKIKLLSK